jgi:integrase
MIYKKPTFEFNSVFAPYIRDYIELRESLGAKFCVQSGVLRQFDRYCVRQGCAEPLVEADLVSDWISESQSQSSSTLAHRTSILKCFSDYMRSVGCLVTWNPYPGYCAQKERYIPYIFTEDEMVRIFRVANNLGKPKGRSMFHLVFPAILKVLYCCGLRVSEALELRVRDVDLDKGLLFIENSKFDNCRRLPISASLLETLRVYAEANKNSIGIAAEGFFFPNSLGEKYSQRTVYDKFRTVLWQSDIPHQGQGKGPRVHDLRHTFAVRSLQKNVAEGKDIYVSLPILMSYLGHSKITSTEKYLRLTAEVYPEFLETAASVCAAILPEVTGYEE